MGPPASLAWPYAFGGRYVFESIDNLARGRPSLYMQWYGDPSANDKWFSYLSLFAQDHWHVSDRLTLGVGVRYQNQFFSRITQTVAGLPPYGWPADNNNVAPRIGASWNPSRSGRTSFNAAYGIFYDNHAGVLWGAPFVLSGTADHTRVLIVPPGQTAAAAWNAPGRRLPQPASYPSLVASIDPALNTPYAHHASVGVDRIFRAQVKVSVQLSQLSAGAPPARCSGDM